MEEAFDEAGKDGGDHAEGEHVEGDGEEDEGGGGTAAFWRMRREGGSGAMSSGSVRSGLGRWRPAGADFESSRAYSR